MPCTGCETRSSLEAGDEVDGWRIEVLRGHADGHIVLLRDGVMIAGDTILLGITPAIGLYPNSRPDPLGDYLETLARIEELAPRVAYAGHKDPIEDPAGRARRDQRASPRAPRRHRSGARRRGRFARTRSRSSCSSATCRRRFVASRQPSRLPISSASCVTGEPRRVDGGYVSA